MQRKREVTTKLMELAEEEEKEEHVTSSTSVIETENQKMNVERLYLKKSAAEWITTIPSEQVKWKEK